MKIEKLNEFVNGLKTFVEFCKSAEISKDNIDVLCQLDDSLSNDIGYMKKLFGPLSFEEMVQKLEKKSSNENISEKSFENWGLKDGKPVILDEVEECVKPEKVEAKEETQVVEEKPTLPGFEENDTSNAIDTDDYIEKKVVEFLNKQTEDYLSTGLLTEMKDDFLKKNPGIKISRVQFSRIFANFEIPGEVWKKYPKYSTIQVSNMGRIKELRYDKWELLSSTWVGKSSDPVRIVKVKTMPMRNPRIAALVLETFAVAADGNNTPGFKNENWRDCRITNLYWKASKRGGYNKYNKKNTEELKVDKTPEIEKVPVEETPVETTQTPGDVNTAKMDEMIQNGYDIAEMFTAVKDLDFGVRLFKRKKELKVELRNRDLVIPILQFIKKPDGSFRSNQEIQTCIYKEYGKLMISNTIIDKVRDKKMYTDISDLVF